MPAKAASVRLQMQSAAWQSGDGNQLQSGTDELAAGYVLSCQALPLTSDWWLTLTRRGWHERTDRQPSAQVLLLTLNRPAARNALNNAR